MFGCYKDYANYPRINEVPGFNYGELYDCATRDAFGWAAAVYFLALIIIGASHASCFVLRRFCCLV